jgi:hypothetical protein
VRHTLRFGRKKDLNAPGVRGLRDSRQCRRAIREASGPTLPQCTGFPAARRSRRHESARRIASRISSLDRSGNSVDSSGSMRSGFRSSLMENISKHASATIRSFSRVQGLLGFPPKIGGESVMFAPGSLITDRDTSRLRELCTGFFSPQNQ